MSSINEKVSRHLKQSESCNHKSDLGKWKVRYYCDIEVIPEFKVTCVKCKCDMSDFMVIPKGLYYRGA